VLVRGKGDQRALAQPAVGVVVAGCVRGPGDGDQAHRDEGAEHPADEPVRAPALSVERHSGSVHRWHEERSQSDHVPAGERRILYFLTGVSPATADDVDTLRL
jgi:hypothetical protein